MQTGRLIEILICLVLGAMLTACIARVGMASVHAAEEALDNYNQARQIEEALIEECLLFT